MENELNERERAALDGIPRDVEPRPQLRERVLQDLRHSGLLRPRHDSILAIAAALIIGLIGGMFLPRPAARTSHQREFILFVHDTPGMRNDGAEAQRIDEYRRWAQGLRARGTLTDGQKLTDDVSAVGASNRPSDVGGFFRIVARDRAEAEAVARSCPHVRHGGWIEVREIDHV